MSKKECRVDGRFASGGFALLVVLFILLIIIGTAYSGPRYGCGGYYC
ncbi:YjcZ family sporulation protein [Oceanobacillus indicireducens]|uniref:YjcZ family sporulation protein n=1 Tax=Oceanobacillus indicireducens TaxID=1004261 RepID=A0A918D350_9BACI|nr:YjcZ family sporulation protein [Oceanobacillus indicireducens]GGN60719.1 hypothetical protein GCM10007971_24980 [Oceanobacillus indicireducens]